MRKHSIAPLIAAMLAPTTSAGQPPRVSLPPLRPTISALLVAPNYSNSGLLSELRFTEPDTALMASALTDSDFSIAEPSRVTIMLGVDLTPEQVIQSLREKIKELAKNERVLFYWAGHSDHDTASDDVYLYFPAAGVSKVTEIPRISLTKDIIPLSSEASPFIFLGDGCKMGDATIGRWSVKYPYITVLTSAKQDEMAIDGIESLGHSPFAYYLAEILRGPALDYDADGWLSLEEVYVQLYPRVAGFSQSFPQHPTISGTLAHRVIIARADKKQSAFYVDDELLASLSGGGELWVNDQAAKSWRLNAADRRLLLSEDDSGLLQRGANLIETRLEQARRKFLAWKESDKLASFSDPYKSSRAIVVAIDDYERKADALRRGSTGFGELGGMGDRARELASTLTKLGFDEKNIVLLLDSDATSDRIVTECKKYWEGGEFSGTSRLFFYFGGHGYTRNGRSFLATYDVDKTRPTLSSIDLEDFIQDQSRSSACHHVLFTFDSCFSGIALQKDIGDADHAAFESLSIIRADVEMPGRNVMVAGTNDQAALWENNGGVFTKSLILGLQGSGDTDNNGVLQFDELAGYVRRRVTIAASEAGVRQDPNERVLSRYGTGRVVFLLSREASESRR